MSDVATEEIVVSTWVGRAIAQHILDNGTTTNLALKVEAAKPTKAGDRTIKLTSEEAAELSSLCTKLEEEGGSALAYSARKLRERLV